MSQNKNKASQKPSKPSTDSTENEQKQPDEQNSTGSDEQTTDPQGAGDTQNGAGDANSNPDDQNPTDDQNGPENGSQDPTDDAAAMSSPLPGGQVAPSALEGQPIDAATGNIKWSDLGSPEEGAPQGKILGPDDDVSFDGEQVGNMVLVKENVYRKVTPLGSNRPSYVLLYRKGTQVPATSVQSQG